MAGKKKPTVSQVKNGAQNVEESSTKKSGRKTSRAAVVTFPVSYAGIVPAFVKGIKKVRTRTASYNPNTANTEGKFEVVSRTSDTLLSIAILSTMVLAFSAISRDLLSIASATTAGDGGRGMSAAATRDAAVRGVRVDKARDDARLLCGSGVDSLHHSLVMGYSICTKQRVYGDQNIEVCHRLFVRKNATKTGKKAHLRGLRIFHRRRPRDVSASSPSRARRTWGENMRYTDALSGRLWWKRLVICRKGRIRREVVGVFVKIALQEVFNVMLEHSISSIIESVFRVGGNLERAQVPSDVL